MDTTVTIVLDGEFGERLRGIRPPTWIVDSATNRAALEAIRRTNPELELTLFRDSPALSASEAFAEVLGAVDLHHGPLGQEPPYDRLEVYGARPNHAVHAALESVGFTLEGPTAEGFAAKSTRSA